MNADFTPGRRVRPLRAALAALLIPVAAALAAGCARDTDVLARVGEREITRDEFLSVARANAQQYPGPPDSAKRQLLDDMVRRDLLLSEASRLGLDRDPTPGTRRAVEDAILSQALLERIAPREVPVSEAEIVEFHRWRAVRAKVFLIYTPGRALADAAVKALRAGEPFARVADRYNVTGMLPPGGDVGWISAGQLVSPLDDLTRSAPLATPIGPLEAPGQGWFVMVVTDRKRQEPAPLEMERPFLADMIRQRKQRMTSLRALQSLRDSYRLEIDPRAAQVLQQRVNPVGQEENALQARPDDQAFVLASFDGGRWDSGRYTMADALRDAVDPELDRPPYTSTFAVEAWIESQALRRMAVVEARRRHMDEEPEIARRIRGRLENATLQRAFEELVLKGIQVSPEEVRAYYTARSEAFSRLVGARLLVAETGDSVVAGRVALAARTQPLADALSAAGLAAVPQEIDVRFPGPDPLWNSLQARIQSAPLGDILGPLQVATGWRIAQIQSKDLVPVPYDDLAPEIHQNLTNELHARRQDERLQAVTAALRRRYAVVVHAQRLQQVVWPAPTPPETRTTQL
jgi:peptidyl-prolyl cis-trans isomerase C